MLSELTVYECALMLSELTVNDLHYCYQNSLWISVH